MRTCIGLHYDLKTGLLLQYWSVKVIFNYALQQMKHTTFCSLYGDGNIYGCQFNYNCFHFFTSAIERIFRSNGVVSDIKFFFSNQDIAGAEPRETM